MRRTIGHLTLALAGLLATAACSGTEEASNDAVNTAANSTMPVNESAEINTAAGIPLNLDAAPPTPSAAQSTYSPPLDGTVTD